jgi:hypothetical protein
LLQRYARPLGLTLKDLQQALELLPAGADDAVRRAA